VGRIGLKAFGWFVTASLVSLTLGLFLANLFKPGANLNLPLPDAGLSTNLKTGGLEPQGLHRPRLPEELFEAMATDEILQILVFSLFFGLAVAALKGRPAVTITRFVDELAHVMLKLTDFVMLFAPMGVFGAVAAAITTQGIGVLATYGKFIGTFYVSLVLLWTLLVAAGFAFLGPRVFKLMGMVREPMMIAFTTASSEAAYPKLME
jgi:Na+/H+-dicarboxylate symporter